MTIELYPTPRKWAMPYSPYPSPPNCCCLPDLERPLELAALPHLTSGVRATIAT